MTNQENRFSPTWVEVKRFVATNGVAVIIKKSDHRFPHFSYELGLVYKEGAFGRHFNVQWGGNGRIRTERWAETIGELVGLAEDYIEEEIQILENSRLEVRELGVRRAV